MFLSWSMHMLFTPLFEYGWSHRNTTRTSIQISQLLEWVRPCKWVRSKATGHVHSPKYTITRHIWYLLISQQNIRKTSIQISDGENSLMRKFWWKNFFRGIFDHEKSLYHMVTRTHREIRFLWFVLLLWCDFFMFFMKFPV